VSHVSWSRHVSVFCLVIPCLSCDHVGVSTPKCFYPWKWDCCCHPVLKCQLVKYWIIRIQFSQIVSFWTLYCLLYIFAYMYILYIILWQLWSQSTKYSTEIYTHPERLDIHSSGDKHLTQIFYMNAKVVVFIESQYLFVLFLFGQTLIENLLSKCTFVDVFISIHLV